MVTGLKHPLTGQARIEWQTNALGVHEAYSVQAAKYRRGAAYSVRSLFATIRPQFTSDGLFAPMRGWVVSRFTFDDLASFSTLSEAKVYVESLFELER